MQSHLTKGQRDSDLTEIRTLSVPWRWIYTWPPADLISTTRRAQFHQKLNVNWQRGAGNKGWQEERGGEANRRNKNSIDVGPINCSRLSWRWCYCVHLKPEQQTACLPGWMLCCITAYVTASGLHRGKANFVKLFDAHLSKFDSIFLSFICVKMFFLLLSLSSFWFQPIVGNRCACRSTCVRCIKIRMYAELMS